MLSINTSPIHPFLFAAHFFLFHVNFGQQPDKIDSISALAMNNYEIAGRCSQVRPQEDSPFNDLTQYTIALSKFIVDHHIQVQTDFSLPQGQNKALTHIYRLQFELSF